MRSLIAVLVFLVTTSFLQTDPKKDTSLPVRSVLQTNNLNITLGYFNESVIPGQSGSDCSERYAFDTLALRMHKMILFTDMGSLAILKINGKLVTCKGIRSERKGKEIIMRFSGDGYQVKFTSKEIKKLDDEYWIRSGVIEIEKGGLKKTFNVMGNYGC